MITKFLIIVSVAAFVFSARIPEPELRIVGGAVVPIEKAPYQVAILWYGIQTCGGVIYSERIILTAARCIQPTELDNYSVRVGSSFPSVGDQVVRIRKARIHEQYLRKANQVDPHDIAVLLLDCSLKLGTLRVNNINLATKLPRLGTECLVTGWGDTVFASTLGAPALRGVNITIVDHASCQKVYGSKYAAEKQVCASGQKKGSCAGDYGGPLVCFPNRELVAIVQGGLYCGEPDLPGVYGSVVYFRDWISSTIRSLECEESQGSLEKNDGNMEIFLKPEVRNVNKSETKVEASHGYQPAIGTLNEVETNPKPELSNVNNNENNIQIIPSLKIINVNKINIKVKLLYTPEISNVNKNEIKIESTPKPEIGNINNTESIIEIFPKPEKRNVNNNEIKAETTHGYQPAIGTLNEVETNPEPELSNDNNNENNVQITPSPKIVNVNKINIKVKLLYTPEISNVNKNEIKIESTPKPEIGKLNNTESNIEIFPKPEKRNVNNNEIKAETCLKPEIAEDHENERSITIFPTPEITNIIFPRPKIINENKIEIKFELLSKPEICNVNKTEGTVESSPNPDLNVNENLNEIPEPEPPINNEN